jgi:hypothetical protein
MHSSVKKHSNCMRPKKKSFTCLEQRSHSCILKATNETNLYHTNYKRCLN